jgi:hypothetical protein
MYSVKYPVEKMCSVLGISRSAYYEWLIKRPIKNRFKWLQKVVIKEFSASKKTYGSP